MVMVRAAYCANGSSKICAWQISARATTPHNPITNVITFMAGSLVYVAGTGGTGTLENAKHVAVRTLNVPPAGNVVGISLAQFGLTQHKEVHIIARHGVIERRC